MLSYDKMTTLSVGSQDQLDGMGYLAAHPVGWQQVYLGDSGDMSTSALQSEEVQQKN